MRRQQTLHFADMHDVGKARLPQSLLKDRGADRAFVNNHDFRRRLGAHRSPAFRRAIHSTPRAGSKPCNYEQLGLAPACQSGRSSMQQAAAPKVSFVSLGCPKALVDSERIITRLRAEGYELARKHDGADLVIVNTCGFLDSAKQESLGAIGEAMAENGKVIVTGCMGAEPEQIEAAYPGVLSITGPQQYESVLDAVHRALPPVHNPHLDLVPPQGIKLTPRHYAYLKISEGCNNRCSFCIIPKLRGDLVSRPAGEVLREAEKLVNRRRQGIAGHLAGYLGLWRGHEICRKPVEGSRGARQILRSGKGARRTRRLGAAAICLSLPACRRSHRPDDAGQGAALSRYSLSARQSGNPQGHEAPGGAGKDAGADQAVARAMPRSDAALHLHRRLSRRNRFRFCLSARLA